MYLPRGQKCKKIREIHVYFANIFVLIEKVKRENLKVNNEQRKKKADVAQGESSQYEISSFKPLREKKNILIYVTLAQNFSHINPLLLEFAKNENCK